jgi:hypothetical protein
MAPVYSLAAINARLQAVENLIDAGGGNGFLQLLALSTVISTIQLARPSGIVNGGVLTFSGTLLDPAAAGTGNITSGRITDSNGVIILTDMSVGTPSAPADITISNGLNTILITAGQTVQVLAAAITGS